MRSTTSLLRDEMAQQFGNGCDSSIPSVGNVMQDSECEASMPEIEWCNARQALRVRQVYPEHLHVGYSIKSSII